ncbi:MAG TPA: hypothetical protein VJL78_04490 [Candidatus Nitrosocosmicus sp.]|jgi:hypothetical protein|nr:hypothetical protein [Candidatus Nitrosocosmicus sp.]
MRLIIHRFDPKPNDQSPFTLLLTKGTKVLGYNFSMNQQHTLVCIEDDSVREKEKRTFQWIRDGDVIENLEDYKYLGTRNGYRYLFEITGKEIE